MPDSNLGQILCDPGPGTKPVDDSMPAPSPRATALEHLAADVARLAAAGDLEGARALHEVLGRLLGHVARDGAGVVDLARERDRRSR